jgi:hypothetical protein
MNKVIRVRNRSEISVISPLERNEVERKGLRTPEAQFGRGAIRAGKRFLENSIIRPELHLLSEPSIKFIY